jgi:hypothetical protein
MDRRLCSLQATRFFHPINSPAEFRNRLPSRNLRNENIAFPNLCVQPSSLGLSLTTETRIQVLNGKKARSVTPQSADTTTPPTHRRRHHRLVVALLWVGSILAILAIGALIAGNIFLHRAGPMLKAKVIETLSNRFDSRVELAQFHVIFNGGFHVSGEGLKLYPNHLDGHEPLFAINKFSFRVFDWRQLLHTPLTVDRVQVSGLSIHLPPKDQRSNMPHVGGHGNGKIDILVRVIDVDQADLVIENGKPGKVPLDFVIHKLVLQSVGNGRPMRFHATLINPKPIGNIDSTGDFGPFDTDSPGDTPVDGTYSFSHADLGTIKGIGGILSSEGKYQGQLDHIVVDGKTTTPDFSLDIAHRPVPLNTTFHAIVDGTNGDTYLQPVDAWLQNTHIVAKGAVVRVQGVKGRDIHLDVTIDPGHIEDVLHLSLKDPNPIMTGQLQLHTKFDLPPGPASVTDKLNLQGSFALSDTRFTSDKIQSKVDELSLRGQGKAKEANQEGQAVKDEAQNKGDSKSDDSKNSSGKDQDQNKSSSGQNQADLANIASNMRGNFTFGNAKITLPAINFRVPGADIALHGVYGIDNQSLDFNGLARLDAHISQMVTGWKSWLLKPVDPFFAKDGAGTQVPIKVGGSTQHPAIGLDFGHKDKDKNKEGK